MTTTSTSIKYFLAAAFAGFLVGCQNPEKEGGKSEVTRPEEQIPAKTSQQEKQDKPPKLNDKNAQAFLQKYGKNHKQNRATIHTPKGDIVIRLYENTPLHRANFIYLTEQNYFDGTWFYRVSRDHVIQAGNNDESKTARQRRELGHYTVPPEMDVPNIHKRGAVAAARSYDNNEKKRSDPYEFYIVMGKSYTAPQLRAMEDQYENDLTQRQMKIYQNQGGSPHLDGKHTVFGEVIKGMDAVRAINQVETDEGEWPIEEIPIKVELK